MKREPPVRQRASLGRHLRLISSLTLGLALALVALIVVTSHFYLALKSLAAETQVQAMVLADNAAASLLFQDKDSAQELLQALRHTATVNVATLYDAAGRSFAHYAIDEYATPASMQKQLKGASLGIRQIEVTQPIRHENRSLGQVYLQIGLAKLYGKLAWEVLIILTAATISLLLARRLSTRLSISLLQPMSYLTRIMQEASEKADYGVRAPASDILELDVLSKGFNAMLEQIRARDKELATHRDHLETEVAARTSELRAAKDIAERANRAKSEFLSRMSHELRTPMNAILGFGQLLEYDDTLSEEQQDNVQEILKAGQHLLELINEVLDLAKVESGRIELSLEPVEVDSVIEMCLTLMGPLANQHAVGLTHTGERRAVVRADQTRFKQTLLNLLSNAIKYNREGGSVNLEVRSRDENWLRITVTDTGRGIPAERLPELFQPFNRLEAENSKIEGTGIGLTLTRRLVELMGGTAGVKSELGKGSTVWMELPVGSLPGPHQDLTQEIETIEHPLPREGAGPAQQHLLYIEDNPANLKLMAQILAQRPHIHLLTAHAPRLGIDLARAHRPDLILLDINLPGMDGYEVLETLRADARLKDIPVVAVTANAMPRDIERGKAAGFDAYLTKPINVTALFDILGGCLPGGEESKP